MGIVGEERRDEVQVIMKGVDEAERRPPRVVKSREDGAVDHDGAGLGRGRSVCWNQDLGVGRDGTGRLAQTG